MSLYKLPPSAIIHSFSESYAVMVNHLPSCICLMWQRYIDENKSVFSLPLRDVYVKIANVNRLPDKREIDM
jgi:hypothetical protein